MDPKTIVVDLGVSGKTDPTVWVAHRRHGPTIWAHDIGVHATNRSARDQVDIWIEDEFFVSRSKDVYAELSKGQLRDLYKTEFPDLPYRILKLDRPADLVIPDDGPHSRLRIDTPNVEVVGWLVSGGIRYDIDGGVPTRHWRGVTKAKAIEVLLMLGCRTDKAAEALDAAGSDPMLLLDAPLRADVWVALVALGPRLEDHRITLHPSKAAAEQEVDEWVERLTPVSARSGFRTDSCDVLSRRVLP